MTPTTAAGQTLTKLDDVVIRFAGDSGDGMQLTGNEFTKTSAIIGNDIATFPDFPAEIRAPAGTLPGVSGFQVRFASKDIHSPGDAPDCLVAMNPAALKVNYKDVKKNGILIVNTGNFSAGDLKKAGYDYNPLESHDLDGWRVVQVDLNKLTREALKDTTLDPKETVRCKNFFALGMTYWLFNRPLETTLKWIHEKFKKKPEIAAANEKVLRAGVNYCDIVGLFQTRYDVPPAKLAPGTYRNIMGNEGTRAGSRRGVAPQRPQDHARVLPDHAGERHPAPAVGLQELGRRHVPGRGRDRRGLRRDRRVVRAARSESRRRAARASR